MNYWNLIPWSISLISLIIAGLSFLHNSSKDKTASIREDDLKFDGIKESLLKANMKLIPSIAVPVDVIDGARVVQYAGSQGYVVDVYNECIELKGRDFVSGEYLPIADYCLNTTLKNIEAGTYTDNTGTITT